MKIQALTYEDYQKLVANPQENALIIWHAEWAAPSKCHLTNLTKLQDIPDLTAYKIDIENPEIPERLLNAVYVTRVPFSFLIKKGKPGVTRKYAGCMKLEDLIEFIK